MANPAAAAQFDTQIVKTAALVGHQQHSCTTLRQYHASKREQAAHAVIQSHRASVHLPVSTSPRAMHEPIPKCDRVQTLSASGETRSSSHGLPERKTARVSFSARLTRAAAEKKSATTPEAKSTAGERRFARPRRAPRWHRVSPASNYLHRRTSTSTSHQVRPDHTPINTPASACPHTPHTRQEPDKSRARERGSNAVPARHARVGGRARRAPTRTWATVSAETRRRWPWRSPGAPADRAPRFLTKGTGMTP